MTFAKGLKWWLIFISPAVLVGCDGFKQLDDVRNAYDAACEGRFAVDPCGGIEAMTDHLGVFVVLALGLVLVVSYKVAWSLSPESDRPT